MNRRDFMQAAGAAGVLCWAAPATALAAAHYQRTLILVELKGGNDGLNTVIPYADPQYAALRPRLAIARDQILQLDAANGLHPSLAPLMAMWQAGELAVVRGVGYPSANLSHFRSIEIWDTASRSNEYLQSGWLARTFAATPVPAGFAADAVVVGSPDLGPFVGKGSRTIALTNTEQFLKQARLASAAGHAKNQSLDHILRVEQDIAQAASGLTGNYPFRTVFPQSRFGNATRTALQAVASHSGVAAIKLSLSGFDTHSGQLGTHARLLKDLAEGLAALKAGLVELGRWDSTLVMTYAEFGRRPRENASSGTDHGTASSHFVMGGKVNGGLFGAAPKLDALDGAGNLAHTVDFRDLYATVLERWWGVEAKPVLHARFAPLEMLRL